MILLHITVIILLADGENRSALAGLKEPASSLNALPQLPQLPQLPEPMIPEAKWCFLMFSVGSMAVASFPVF